jgi:hypothetical protein
VRSVASEKAHLHEFLSYWGDTAPAIAGMNASEKLGGLDEGDHLLGDSLVKGR